MALLDIGNAWAADDTTDLFKKFLGACLTAAKDIIAESAGTSNHANRMVWANAVMSANDPAVKERVRQIIRFGAATNATMQANPSALTDNDIQFIVNGSINTFATGG